MRKKIVILVTLLTLVFAVFLAAPQYSASAGCLAPDQTTPCPGGGGGGGGGGSCFSIPIYHWITGELLGYITLCA